MLSPLHTPRYDFTSNLGTDAEHLCLKLNFGGERVAYFQLCGLYLILHVLTPVKSGYVHKTWGFSQWTYVDQELRAHTNN